MLVCVYTYQNAGNHISQLNLLTVSFPFGKHFIVGKLWTLTSSNSLAVASILAITIASESAYFSPNLSQIGASCLQCPHQGASVTKRTYDA